MKQSNKGLQIEISSETQISSKPPSVTNIVTTSKEISSTLSVKSSDLMREYRAMIERNETMPLLTLFTSWGDSADKYLVHNLTSINWLSLRPFVVPVLFTNESSVASECEKQGWEVFPIRVAAAGGVPVLKFMYVDVIAAFNSTFYGYANGDILFTNQIVETLLSIAKAIDLEKATLIVGKRTNVVNVTEDEGSSWENITRISKERGQLFTGYAEDYFITQRNYPWKDMPEVVIGRRAYDNWLVYNARKSKHVVIDITESSLAMHQTTAAGNFEGHGHENSHYNDNLLKKIYKSIKYNAGVVECVEQQTKYDDKGVIRVHSRKVSKHCKV